MTTTDTTTTTTTADPTADAIDRYFELWNTTDPAERATRTAEVWAVDGRHVDPLADVAGHDALAAMMAGIHEHYAGGRFERTTGVDAHHDTARYGWRLVGADGNVIVDALDVTTFAADGRIATVVAYFGELPARG
jgi:hypothetical protein